jgi:hypothetical protein
MHDAQLVSKQTLEVFRCGNRPFTINDVIAAAYVRGELDPVSQRLSRSIAAERRAAGMDLSADEEELQKMPEEFRYQRDLITGEETERWLGERGLTLDDFSGYFTRRYWAETLDEEFGPDGIDHPLTDPEWRDLLIVDLFLSGEFDRLAMELSWRVAAGEAAKDAEPDPGLIVDGRAHFMDRNKLDAATLNQKLAEAGCDQQWFDEMLKIEAIYRQQCDAVLTDEAVKSEIKTHRIEFTLADVEMIDLESSDAAAEALLCAREDGEPFDEIAREGGYPYSRTRILIAELPDGMQQRFLCAAPGEVLDPMPRGDGFQLCRILEKIEPGMDDPEIRNRVQKRIIQRHFLDLASRHIHWLIAPSL